MASGARLLAAKFLGAAAQLRFLPRALRLVWAAARGWSLLWSGLLVAQGLLPVAIVYLTRELVDSLTGAIGSGGDWARVGPTVILAVLMGGFLLLGELLRGAADWVRAAQGRLVAGPGSAPGRHKSTPGG